MKNGILLLCLLLTSCALMRPPPLTTEEYCGSKLGLKYGTKAYADCGLRYSKLLIDMENARTARVAAWNAGHQDITVHHSEYF